eukprot:TRINITY_DN25085_c0_g1_i1.p1 TRINITY_DN25085_c0_g1~~TRINITY_DN25085_c0_g1_i1.p1  ORF type:complete len:286 (-),score=53.61 TRINITY_DN25085_c0_g1_i1:324-1181(-)
MGGGELFSIDPQSAKRYSEPNNLINEDHDDLHYSSNREHEHERERKSHNTGEREEELEAAGEYEWEVETAGEHKEELETAGKHEWEPATAGKQEWELETAGEHEGDLETAGEFEGELKSEGERERERLGSRINGELVKIYPQANTLFNLTAEGSTVVLSKAKEDDATQMWYKDDSSGDRVRDSEGHVAFALVNKASRLALKHSADDSEQVTLASFEEGALDDSLLWTLSSDVGDGYKAIRPVTNPKLNLDADHADKEHGGVKESNRLILYKWKKQDNQKWKLGPL